MAQEEMLERFKRKRASIPARTDILAQQIKSGEDSVSLIPESIGQELPKSLEGNTLEELKAELKTLPQTRRHSAIVLNIDIDDALTRFCKEQGITVELFLEAAWVKVENHPAILNEIIADAQRRRAGRNRAGKLRRLITMLEGR